MIHQISNINQIISVKIDAKDRTFFTSDNGNNLKQWDINSAKLVHKYDELTSPIQNIVINKNNNNLATINMSGIINIWDRKKKIASLDMLP